VVQQWQDQILIDFTSDRAKKPVEEYKHVVLLQSFGGYQAGTAHLSAKEDAVRRTADIDGLVVAAYRIQHRDLLVKAQ
jgi:hypothetical protein